MDRPESSHMQDAGNQEQQNSDQAEKLFKTGVMLIYGKRKSISKAIKCIQKAIAHDDSNHKFWLALGEAYYQRGSLNPAINCFMKSLSLAETLLKGAHEQELKNAQDDCTYSKLRMSDIRLAVLHLDEARNGYRDIVSAEPTNVAALIGLSKTELQLARNSFASGLVKTGHSHCMEALRFALMAIKLNPHICHSWKLAADCCLIQFVHGQRGQFETKIDVDFPGCDRDGNLTVNRAVCLELAQQLLSKAIAIEPFQQASCLWHNLGICLYYRSNVSDKDEKESLLRMSLKCLLKALDTDRDSSQIKNSLAVVVFSLNHKDTAHRLITNAIQANLSTSEMQFSNLGLMYLHEGEHKNSSAAFTRCQADEPVYCRSWLGAALISRHFSLDDLSHLRHCQRLEHNLESRVLYANKVISLPDAKEYQKDVISALDSMQRIVNYDTSRVEFVNTLGLLNERSGDLRMAQICFDDAFKIQPNDSAVIFNRLRHHSVDTSCFSIESSTRLSKHSFDGDAIKAAEKLANRGNRDHMLNFMYYLFNNGDYKNISSRMTKLIEVISSDNACDKLGAQIVLALSARKCDEDFKSWLFKNIIDSKDTNCLETIVNLVCLLLLGYQVADFDLVNQVSKDLPIQLIAYLSTRVIQFSDLLETHEGFWIRLALWSCVFCVKDQTKLARQMVALFPDVAELWFILGVAMYFQKYHGRAKEASNNQDPVTLCLTRASEIGFDPDLIYACDMMFALNQEPPAKKSSLSERQIKDRRYFIAKALISYPENIPLRQYVRAEARESEDSQGILLRSTLEHVMEHQLKSSSSFSISEGASSATALP